MYRATVPRSPATRSPDQTAAEKTFPPGLASAVHAPALFFATPRLAAQRLEPSVASAAGCETDAGSDSASHVCTQGASGSAEGAQTLPRFHTFVPSAA